MSATPIPRTLEMSLAGIREMSTILTPPEERYPVLTYVGPHDEKQIAAALRQAGFPQVDSVPVETPFGPMQADIARVPPP